MVCWQVFGNPPTFGDVSFRVTAEEQNGKVQMKKRDPSHFHACLPPALGLGLLMTH